jgi:hypothetical protein
MDSDIIVTEKKFKPRFGGIESFERFADGVG